MTKQPAPRPGLMGSLAELLELLQALLQSEPVVLLAPGCGLVAESLYTLLKIPDDGFHLGDGDCGGAALLRQGQATFLHTMGLPQHCLQLIIIVEIPGKAAQYGPTHFSIPAARRSIPPAQQAT